MSAPAFSNVLITALCPFSAEKCSGVNCCYKIELLKAIDVTYLHIQSSIIKLHSYVYTYTYMIIRYMKDGVTEETRYIY